MNTYKSTQSNTTNNTSGRVINIIGDTNTTKNNHITSISGVGYIFMLTQNIAYFYNNYKATSTIAT